jgi:AcrR family transcriptional regulator
MMTAIAQKLRLHRHRRGGLKAAADTTVPRPRTKPAEIRREELMDAAEKLFIEKGVGTTSVDEIVAVADVAKGTFYLYFESKEDLLAALQERFVAVTCDRLQRAADQHLLGDWTARLRAWVDAGVDAYLDRVALHDVVSHEYRLKNRRMNHADRAKSRRERIPWRQRAG